MIWTSGHFDLDIFDLDIFDLDIFDLDIFDLDINLGRGQTQPQNNFVRVAQAVNEKYPQVQFAQKSFASGTEKTVFIDRCLAQQKPVLPSATAGYE